MGRLLGILFILMVAISASGASAAGLQCQSLFSGDGSEISRAWQLFTLTDPQLELSINARNKLFFHYQQKLIVRIQQSLAEGSINRLQARSIQYAGEDSIQVFLSSKRTSIYRRFEESKKHRSTHPEIYRAEIERINQEHKKSMTTLDTQIQSLF